MAAFFVPTRFTWRFGGQLAALKGPTLLPELLVAPSVQQLPACLDVFSL